MTTSAHAAPALSAEQIENFRQRVDFQHARGDKSIEISISGAYSLLAALAGPARAEVGEDLAGYLVFDKDGRYLDFQTGYDIADGDRRAGLTSRPVYYAAPRPSRPDAGEADPDCWGIFYEVGGCMVHEVAYPSREVAERYARQVKGPTVVAALYRAHPPAPAAEAGRVRELEAALKHYAEICCEGYCGGDPCNFDEICSGCKARRALSGGAS